MALPQVWLQRLEFGFARQSACWPQDGGATRAAHALIVRMLGQARRTTGEARRPSPANNGHLTARIGARRMDRRERGARPTSTHEAYPMRSTRSVIGNPLKCFGEGDLDGILADYAPEAVLFTPQAPLKGADQIRPLLVALLAEFGKRGATFRLNHLSVDGEHGYILWSAETADNVYELATDTFVVRDGKIAAQSFAGKTVPRH
jgi:hypothetical protein